MIEKREMCGAERIRQEKNGTGGLTEYENGNEADGSIHHGTET